MIKVNEDVLIYALRYALGRHTYSVSDVVEVILRNLDSFSQRAICVMAKDIGRLLQTSDDAYGSPIEDVFGNEVHTKVYRDVDLNTWFTCFKALVRAMNDESVKWLIDGHLSGVNLGFIFDGYDYEWFSLDTKEDRCIKDMYYRLGISSEGI